MLATATRAVLTLTSMKNTDSHFPHNKCIAMPASNQQTKPPHLPTNLFSRML